MIILPADAKKAKKTERSMNAARVPRSVRKNYLDLLDQQVKYLKAQTANLSDLLNAGADRSTVATNLAQMAAQAQARLDSLAPGTARSFVDATSKANKEAMQKNIAKALSVDIATVIDGPDIKPLLDQAIADNVDLIKSIGQQHFADVGRAVLDNYRGVPQVGNVSLTERLQKIGGISKNRAKFIARDQTAKLTGDLNQARQQDNGIEEYTWHNSKDRRVVGNPSGLYPKGNRAHGNHWDRENVTFSWAKPPADGHPGHAPNCFPGSTKLDGFPFLQKIYRRRYSGKLAQIVLDNGVILRATPNHPVLTTEGLKPINLLGVGDDVICKINQRGQTIKDHSERFDITLEQVFGALLLVGIGFGVSAGVRSQFHGDGSNEEVDIVSIDGSLISEWDSSACEKGSKLGLSWSDMALCRAFLSGNRSLSEALVARRNTDSRGMSGADLIRSFIVTHLSPLERLGLGLSSDVCAGFDKVSPDDCPSDTKVFGSSIFTYAALVHGADFIVAQLEALCSGRPWPYIGDGYAASPDLAAESVRVNANNNPCGSKSDTFAQQINRVVDVTFFDYFGHVYNLQTCSGHYTANTVQVGNCRCYAKPKLNLEKLKAQYI